MAFQDVLRQAPLYLQRRYVGLRLYVRDIIEQDCPHLRIERISPELIQIVALAYTLRNFFEDGYKAATKAIDVLESLDVTEFQIGAARFARDSEVALLGRRLSESLIKRLVDPSLPQLVVASSSLSALVHKLLDGWNMARWMFKQEATKEELSRFFEQERQNLRLFGSDRQSDVRSFRFCFHAAVVSRSTLDGLYRKSPSSRGRKSQFRLKFSTRGAPDNFSYAVAHGAF